VVADPDCAPKTVIDVLAWKKPELGTVKVIHLSAGDTLVMVPVKFTAHRPVSFGDSFTHMTRSLGVSCWELHYLFIHVASLVDRRDDVLWVHIGKVVSMSINSLHSRSSG
jgi:hypothetical protein